MNTLTTDSNYIDDVIMTLVRTGSIYQISKKLETDKVGQYT